MSVRRSVFWAFLGQGVSAFVGFGSSVVIARLLTPYEFGLNAIAVATSGILAVLAASGADAFIVRETNLTRQVIATATTVNAALYLLLSALLLAISFAAGPILGDGNAGVVVRILAVLPILNIIAFRPAAMLQRTMRFKAAALVASTSIIVNNGVTIAAILLGASYIGPAIGAVSGMLATIVLYAVINPADLRLTFSLTGIGRMTAFGLRMMSVSGAAQFTQHASQIILGRMLGISMLGFYSRAALLANFLFSQVYGTAARVTFAQMSRMNRETGVFSDTYLRSLAMITAVMWPLLLNLAILSGPLIVLLYGARWEAAAAPFSILMATQIVALGFAMNWELFVIRDKVAVQTRYELLRAGAGIGLFALGCLFSMTAAAFGRLADALIGLALYFPWMSRLSGTRNHAIVGAYARSGAIALVTAFPSAALMLHGRGSSDPSLLLLGASAVTSVLLWAAMLRMLAHPLVDEARLVAAAMRRALPGRSFAALRSVSQPDAAALPPEDRLPTDERF